MRLVCFVFFYALFSSDTCWSQQPAPRPKIGVALQGGGAKGLAHIGVLQWFEDRHIPIDYIAGTSMGGLIGGLYATGPSPAEIQQIVEQTDWGAVMPGETPYESLSFRRKEDLTAFPNGLELGLRQGVQLPGGLNSGQAVRFIIDRYVLTYSSEDDLISYRSRFAASQQTSSPGNRLCSAMDRCPTPFEQRCPFPASSRL